MGVGPRQVSRTDKTQKTTPESDGRRPIWTVRLLAVDTEMNTTEQIFVEVAGDQPQLAVDEYATVRNLTYTPGPLSSTSTARRGTDHARLPRGCGDAGRLCPPRRLVPHPVINEVTEMTTQTATVTRDAASLARVLSGALGLGLPAPDYITMHPSCADSATMSLIDFQFNARHSRVLPASSCVG